MRVSEAIELGKEIGKWAHSKTNETQMPNDRRTVLAASGFQHVLDLCDGMIILFDQNLPGAAFALARPVHEGYTQSVWLLDHASEHQIERFLEGICPKLQTLIRQIGDEPGSGGAFIKGMNDKNISDFNSLTHGGIVHAARRVTESTIEPNYSAEDIEGMIRFRNQHYLLSTCFILAILDDESGMKELAEKRELWAHAL